jgi:Fur family iron response transcriptional regulator
MSNLNIYKKKLRESGLRPTRQRLKICELLFLPEKTFHFTINDLTKIIDEKLSIKISLATIYNTVHAFKKKEYLKEISLQGNKTFFDTNSNNHHHFYDQETGILIDIKNDDIILNKVPNAPKGKKIKDIEVTVKIENSNQN